MDLLIAAFSLFLVYNVLGNLPFYIAVIRPFSPLRQKVILIREMIIALFILFLFGFFGESILKFIGVTKDIVGISGGILLLLIALTMVFPKHSDEVLSKHEPLIVPIAIPGMAGPGSIAAVMLYSNYLSHLSVLIVIFLAWLPSLVIVLAATYIRYLVGEKGLIAFERLGGLLMSLISVQMMTSGIIGLVKENFDTPRTAVQYELQVDPHSQIEQTDSLNYT